MPRLLVIVFLLFSQSLLGQTQNTPHCKLEIYLLKKQVPSFDTAYKLTGKYNVSKADLQDTAFIKDAEIISYTIEKFKINNGQRKYKKEEHTIQLSKSINDRIKRVGDIPLCCGIPYAVVVNSEIIYGGYFWNPFSSFSAATTISYLYDDTITFSFMMGQREKDPGHNQILLNCLEKTNRLIVKKTQKVKQK